VGDTSWDPDQYLRFADERARPFFDLVAAIPPVDPDTVADLGCGPGGLTATLLERWPRALIWGVDSSEEMIVHATRRSVDGRLSFELDDITTWRSPRPLDVIVCNACLHWVSDHEAVLDHLISQLAEGGVLAFQVPNSTGLASHRLLAELVSSPGWRGRLAGLERPAIEAPRWYVERLAGRGFLVDAWETTYYHVLQGEDAILEWVSGTTLRSMLSLLGASEREAFMAEYGSLLRRAYPSRRYGTLFPFTRLFVVARGARLTTVDG